ncbi:MAG: protein translocase subunit SecF, partial [Planctomycetes bacterium]|nr:protein translocase subunit SecF [Planctomycetota bacterium]
AVDANVLIYERIREERERGASLPLAIRNGYDRAFPTVIDTHMSSIFTAIVLYVVGNDQLKGFGISLTVGLIISLFTALYMTRVFFDLWQTKGWLKKLSMAKLFSRTRINFMGIRNTVFVITIALSVLGVGLFLLRGKSGLNMDFVGGTVYSGELDEFLNISKLRDRLDETKQQEWLALEKDPVLLSEKSGTWQLVYKKEGDGRERVRQVSIPEKLTATQVRQRAETLPEPSLELIFHSDEKLTQGNESKLFTVRTTEKSSELVSASINRLLGDVLKKNRLETARTNQAILVFPEAVKLDAVRPAILAALREGKVIAKSDSAKDKAELIRKLAPVGGALLAAAAGPGSDSDVTLTGQEETGQKGQYKTATLNFADAKSLSTLADALAPLVKNKKLSTFQFAQARLTLADAAYLASVHSLLGNQFDDPQLRQHMGVTKPEGVQEDESGRFREMLVQMPNPYDGQEFRQAVEKFGTELAARPLPVRLENFDSQLAADMQQRALYAILASWGAMLLYLWFRFGNWTFGLAAVICLIHDLFFTLGMIALCHFVHGTFVGEALALRDFKIDLPAVASLLTLIGFSVNDTIVVFDRIREVRGKNPHLTPEMINDSINQTLSRTVLTSFIAWMVVLVLFIWGGEGVHLFAFVMVFGVIVGTYSSIYVASPLLLLLGEGAPTKRARVRDERPAVMEG